jgi:hypothetical protein
MTLAGHQAGSGLARRFEPAWIWPDAHEWVDAGARHGDCPLLARTARSVLVSAAPGCGGAVAAPARSRGPAGVMRTMVP